MNDSAKSMFATILAVCALLLGGYALSQANSKKSCECPLPQWHDLQNPWKNPPRRPNGSTGSTGTTTSATEHKHDGVVVRDQ